MLFHEFITGGIHVRTEESAYQVFFVFSGKVCTFELFMADKRDCLITAFKYDALDVEMDIPFCTDFIAQMTVKYDAVPYTYRLQASVVKDVFFKFFQVLFFPWLYQLIKFRIGQKFLDGSVVHTDSSVRVISSTSMHSFMEKLARHSFGFNAP